MSCDVTHRKLFNKLASANTKRPFEIEEKILQTFFLSFQNPPSVSLNWIRTSGSLQQSSSRYSSVFLFQVHSIPFRQ